MNRSKGRGDEEDLLTYVNRGCNWGPLVQTGKISVYTSGETTLVAVIITSDEGKTLAQAIAANIMDTSDSSRYFVVPRALSPILCMFIRVVVICHVTFLETCRAYLLLHNCVHLRVVFMYYIINFSLASF